MWWMLSLVGVIHAMEAVQCLVTSLFAYLTCWPAATAKVVAIVNWIGNIGIRPLIAVTLHGYVDVS
jgi:hypothetical protein